MICCICGGIGESIVLGLIALFGLCGVCLRKRIAKNCKCHGLKSDEIPLDDRTPKSNTVFIITSDEGKKE